LPPEYFPGVPLSVNLKIPALGGVQAYAIEEQVPANWQISEASDGGTLDSATGKLKFGPFFDTGARILTYKVVPPLTGLGLRVFSGFFSANGQSFVIIGGTTSAFTHYHPADRGPVDGKINVNELTAYGSA